MALPQFKIREFVRQTGIPKQQERGLRECLRAVRVVADMLRATPLLVGGWAEKAQIHPGSKNRLSNVLGDHMILLAVERPISSSVLVPSAVSPFGYGDEALEFNASALRDNHVESRVLFYPGRIAKLPVLAEDFTAATSIELLDDRKSDAPSLGSLHIADAAFLLAISLMDDNLQYEKSVALRMAVLLSGLATKAAVAQRTVAILQRSSLSVVDQRSVANTMQPFVDAVRSEYRSILLEFQRLLQDALAAPSLPVADTRPELRS